MTAFRFGIVLALCPLFCLFSVLCYLSSVLWNEHPRP